MLETTIAGSLPKPDWLAEPNRLWAPWRQEGEALADAKRDATLLWLKLQQDAGIDIVTDGEQSRQHFVHGFLAFVEGIDFDRQGGDGHPRRSVQGDGADGHRPDRAARPGARDRGSAGAGAHQAAAEIHPARPDDHRRYDRRRALRRQGRAGDGVCRGAERGGARIWPPTAWT